MAGKKVLSYEMAPEDRERVISCLSSFVTEERLDVFKSALSRRTRDVVLVLEDVANGHNSAAVMRSAEAFGLFEIHVIQPEDARFHVSRNVASGANKWLDLYWHHRTEQCFSQLKQNGYEVWVSDLQGEAVSIDEIDVTKRIALVFGNERDGISETARKHADRCFQIPMQGFVESLNISVAAAVSCYELARRRRAHSCKEGLEAADRHAVLAAWLAQSVRAADEILAREGLDIPVIQLRTLSLVE